LKLGNVDLGLIVLRVNGRRAAGEKTIGGERSHRQQEDHDPSAMTGNQPSKEVCKSHETSTLLRNPLKGIDTPGVGWVTG